MAVTATWWGCSFISISEEASRKILRVPSLYPAATHELSRLEDGLQHTQPQAWHKRNRYVVLSFPSKSHTSSTVVSIRQNLLKRNNLKPLCVPPPGWAPGTAPLVQYWGLTTLSHCRPHCRWQNGSHQGWRPHHSPGQHKGVKTDREASYVQV